jgi:hypothetical protein
MTLYTWSKTAANNATADATINWAEGQAPATVNNSSRAEMSAVAKARDDWSGTLTTGGTSTAYTLTTNQVFTTAALMSGAMICFIPHATNGASPTLAVDGLTARAINVSTGVAVPTGALLIGTPYVVTYIHATTEFILQGELAVLQNNSVATASIANDAVTDAKLRDSGALSVIGRSVNSSGDPADISATAASGAVFRESGSALGFGTLAAAAFADATISYARLVAAATAAQSDQETGTSTTTIVTPGRQHFHAAHPKAAAKITVAGGVPTLQTSTDYNITSVADMALGRVEITLATDFSDSQWICNESVEASFNNHGAIEVGSQTAGTVILQNMNHVGNYLDPSAYHMIGTGDHA